MRRVVISGPESTGKTEMAIYLSSCYRGIYVPEYARDYISRLSRPYNYDDLVKISLKQAEQYDEIGKGEEGYIFFDTWLVVTKVWFVEVFNRYPDWLDEKLYFSVIDLYLLCFPDIPWVPDPLRENGGEKRIFLFNAYEKEIRNIGTPYRIIKGNAQERNDNAVSYINDYFR